MANEGMMFTSFYAQPSCTPGRAAMQTGRIPNRSGMTTVAFQSTKELSEDGLGISAGPFSLRAERMRKSRTSPFGPILLQKSAAMDLAVGPFVEPRSEALALTHFTQLRRYAMRRA